MIAEKLSLSFYFVFLKNFFLKIYIVKIIYKKKSDHKNKKYKNKNIRPGIGCCMTQFCILQRVLEISSTHIYKQKSIASKNDTKIQK